MDFFETAFQRTFAALSRNYPDADRRHFLASLLDFAQREVWIDWEHWEPGSLGAASLCVEWNSNPEIVTRIDSAIEAHPRRKHLGADLATVLSDRWTNLSRYASIIRQIPASDFLLESLMFELDGIPRFLTVLLRTEIGADLSELMEKPRGGPAISAMDLLFRTVRTVVSHELPTSPSTLPGLVLGRIIEHLTDLSPADHDPVWWNHLSEQHQTILQQVFRLEVNPRFVFLAVVYGGLTTDQLLVACRNHRVRPVATELTESEVASQLMAAWTSLMDVY
ncbi:MAG: hypothetical protein KDA96_00600 [Planctomycetaceae bacterium]|nr:hypothetical protein [Planctomycetaceae bacterium]